MRVKKRAIIKRVGSAQNESESDLLMADAAKYAEAHRRQSYLFPETPAQTCPSRQLDLSHAWLVGVTHFFARNALLTCARLCGLGALLELYLDFALKCFIVPVTNSELWSFFSCISMFVMLNRPLIDCCRNSLSIKRRSRLPLYRLLTMRWIDAVSKACLPDDSC